MNLTVNSTFDQVAQAIVVETKRRKYTRDESIAVLSTGIQESGLRPKAISPNGAWIGIFQQDDSYPGRADPNQNILEFLNRLDNKRAAAGALDIWKNIFWLQQRPGEPSAAAAYRNGRQAYLTEIKSHTAQAGQLYDRFGGNVADNRPDFNEYPVWSGNSQDRAGTKIDLFLLHTEEGNSNADQLAHWLDGNGVSYHYTVSEDYRDHGVTVCDVVDTDEASWSVLSANNRSINLVFAGSKAGWSRADWLKQSRAIDVAAYLAVQDCKKYGIPLVVIPPPYTAGRAGISDHNYVTKVLKDGTHTDVGNGFPWDKFQESFQKYANQIPTPAPVPTPAYPSQQDMIIQIWEQLLGPKAQGWPQLDNKTLVDAVAELLDKAK